MCVGLGLFSICRKTSLSLVVLVICCLMCFDYHIILLFLLFLSCRLYTDLIIKPLCFLHCFLLFTCAGCTRAEGLLETTFLPPRGSCKACVYSTLPRLHLLTGIALVCCCYRVF